MTRVGLFAVAAVLMTVAPAAAQTSFVVQFNKPFTVAFDDPDDPTGLDGFNVLIDGVIRATHPATILDPVAKVGTFVYPGLSKGVHTLIVEAYVIGCDDDPDSICTARSTPVTVRALPGRPTAPTNVKVRLPVSAAARRPVKR